jgi:outer membrane protein OmpA-like peptidoglycan-associated protein
MKSFQSLVQKAIASIIVWLSFLTIFGCAGLDPRDVKVELEEEFPIQQKTIFYDSLINLGDMTEIYTTKELKIQCTAVTDDTGSSLATKAEIPHDITEMLKSSLNSIGGRVTYIPYAPNYAGTLVNQLGYPIEKLAIADVAITGGITEFDRGLETKGKNLNLAFEEEIYDRPIGLDFSTERKSSVANVTLDFNLINLRTMAGLPRMQTVNSVRVHKAVSERELGFTILGPTFGFKGTLKKIQGRHEAVRLLVQLSAIQIVGRYLKIPYWRLLPNAEPDPVVLKGLKSDYGRMDFTQKVFTLQKLLILNGYVVPVTGVLDTQTNVAIQKFDNRYDPERQNISENVFLNLYFSIPLDPESKMIAGPIVAESMVDDPANSSQNKSKSNDEKINAPEVDTIIESLRGISAKQDNQALTQPKFEVDINIPFGLNEYQISNEALPYLQRLGTALSDPGLKTSIFEIQGHTCNLGREDYNLWLSQKRAEAVKNYLVRYFGLSTNQLKAVGYGPRKAKWNNSTEKGRTKNRRVTIVNTLKNYENITSRPSLKVVAKYNRAGKMKKLLPGTALSPRDNYFLTFTPDQACYVYIFQFDSRKTVTQLFPNPDFTRESNPVVSERGYRIPGSEGGWLFLDENKGEEELIVMAYPEPLPDPLKVALSLIGYYDSKLFPFPDNDDGAATRGAKGIRQSPDDILFIWRNKFRHID